MAVTTQITSTPQYILSGGSLPGCIGGGEDYRTLHNDTVTDTLYIQGWVGDNISNACVITNIMVKGCQCKLTSTSGGYTIVGRSCNVRRSAVVSQGSVSGTNFNRTTGTTLENTGSYVSMNRNDYASIGDNNFNYRNASEQQLQYVQANKAYPGVKIEFQSPDNIRGYIKGITLTVTRTRACYITFNGDGITESTTMYDYGTVPSYGSTPTRYGYTFKGWSNGSTTYSGTLPTAYEQDVIYTAVWEKTPCTITYDLNGGIAVNEDYKTQSGFIGESINLPKIYVGEGKQTEDMPFSKSCKVLFDYNYDNKTEFILSYAPLSGPISGWYTEDGTRVGGSGDSYTPNGDTTLHARWDNFNAIKLISKEREGYTFLGWYTKLNGGERVGGSNDSYTPKEPVTLYAHWKRNSINRIYIGTEKPKFYKGKKPIRSIYLGTSLIYRVFLPKISYDRIKTFGNLLVPLPEDTPKTYTLPEANLENAEGNVSYALYSDSKCKTPVGAGITFDENTRQVTISNAAKDTVAAQDTYKDGLAKFYVKATYKNLSTVGEITLKNYKVTATFSYRNVEGAYIDKTTEVYYGTSVEEFAKGITDFWLPENDENYHYTIIGWVDLTKKSTIKNVNGNTTFDLLFNAKLHEINPNIDGYEKKVPTCTESGYIKGYCGYCAKQENGYKGLLQVNSPATGHKDTNGDNICDICGEIFVDSGACGNNLTYTLDNNGVLTISGTGDMQNSSFGWNKNKIKSVIINDGVTNIGDSAFSGCTSLISVIIPDSVTIIGSDAFSRCSGLTSITIPDNVTNISSSAFSHCTGLTSITIPNSVTNISNNAFSNCHSLTTLTIPDNVTSIGENAFSRCDGLTTLTIPDSVTSIGNSAFSDCYGLTSITIGNSVTSIGYGTFRNCYSLTDITVSTGNTVYHSDNNCLIETESKTLILGCKNSVIPSNGSVTNIGFQAFFYCTGLTSITIPNSITRIDGQAFTYCRNLTEVNFSTRTDIPTLESPDVFDNTSDSLSIKVPSDLVDRWKAATNWDAYADKIKGV